MLMSHFSKQVEIKIFNNAFTLVELLVVIAIIAGLVGLLLPNLRKFQEHALLTQCQDNLREIGKAVGQYMQDYEGYFVYPGPGGASADEKFHESFKGNPDDYGLAGIADKIAEQSAGAGTYLTASPHGYYSIIYTYVPYQGISLSNLSAGIAPIRACPVVLQDIKKNGNFFDPRSPNFKGWQLVTLPDGSTYDRFDFQQAWTGDYYEINSRRFTTYGINPLIIYKHQKDINPNAIAFMDWNAKDGWEAYLGYTNWMFTTTNRPVNHNQGDPKWTNAWWLTEVGFYHPADDGRGASYLAFDGHVGIVSSNKISYNFMLGK